MLHQMSAADAKHSNTEKMLEYDKENLKNELSKVSTEYKALESRIAKYKGEVSDPMSAAETHQGELIGQSYQIHKLETQKADHTLQTEEKFKKLSAEKSDLTTQKKNLSDAHSQLSNSHKQLHIKHGQLEAEHKNASTEKPSTETKIGVPYCKS